MAASDGIEKQVRLRAPVSRVWRAITDSAEFGRWFGVELDGEFALGKPVMGRFKGMPDEAVFAEHQRRLGLPPSRVKLPQGAIVFCTPQCIEPEHYFSYRWIPHGIDAEIDPQTEPTTLVEFRLEAVAGGTLLTITESGFDHVPAHRRERAFRMNDFGWAAQARNIASHVDRG